MYFIHIQYRVHIMQAVTHLYTYIGPGLFIIFMRENSKRDFDLLKML